MRQTCFFTTPVYAWHGGILDPEEIGGPTGDNLDPGKLLFGDRFAQQETESQHQARRKRNRETIAFRLTRDATRRRSAEQRQRLFGDPMITEEQLRELHVVIREDAPTAYGLNLNWTSVRLWERDANELVQELPFELLGLAMLAAPSRCTREEILEKAMWRLRRLKQRAEFERLMIPVAAMARVWIADDRSEPIVARAHKRYLPKR